jgi:type II secretory pathway predicted ATPase ExeA
MYNSFFGIHACPFGSSPDPRFLYVMPQIRETLACLEYGITARKGFVVMTGEVGTGKTTLLRTVLSRFESDHVSTAFVFNPRLDVIDFLEFVLNDFGIMPSARTKSAMLIQLNRWLLERFRNKGVCVVVVDEAQNLSWELLEEIRLLTNLETSSEKLLQIVLSGQPELEDKLCHESIRQLRQRVWMWCKTRPLTHQETQGYVAQRLHAAGATEPIFTDDALWLVHNFSKGIPRVINLICEHALIDAFVEQIKPIPGRIVEAIGCEFVLDKRPFVISPAALSNSPGTGSLQVTHNFIKPVSEKEHDL